MSASGLFFFLFWWHWVPSWLRWVKVIELRHGFDLPTAAEDNGRPPGFRCTWLRPRCQPARDVRLGWPRRATDFTNGERKSRQASVAMDGSMDTKREGERDPRTQLVRTRLVINAHDGRDGNGVLGLHGLWASVVRITEDSWFHVIEIHDRTMTRRKFFSFDPCSHEDKLLARADRFA
jgi:hypothetical protein